MNMSYCRFQNTVADLRDCYDHIWDKVSAEEEKARNVLVKLCREIVEDLGESPEEEECREVNIDMNMGDVHSPVTGARIGRVG